MPFAPGDTFFEYRITRLLGQGGFGAVYLAQDTLLDRPVAIKELNAAAQVDPVAFQRFLQEARAAGSLSHPNIITVYALKPAEQSFYLVMEYLPGGSLRALLSQRGRLPVDDAVRIALDVCHGLAAAHAKGIVHRDVKPENILLTAQGRAKVGDFGIAHVPRAVGAAYLGGLTEAGFQPGTLLYMSPEQIRGEAVDDRSDVYQVGTLLYEMLTGRCTIDMAALTRRAQETAGGNVLRMQARLYELLEDAICNHEPQDLRRMRPEVPAWLGATVAATLAQAAATRPTAKRLAGELRVGAKSRPAGQDTGGRRAMASGVDTVFGKRMVGEPDSAEQSPPDAMRKIGMITPPAAAGAEMAHMDRGDAALSEGRLDEAIREFKAALRLNPKNAEAHYNLGWVYRQQGHTEEAIREYQAALQVDPRHAGAHFDLGLAYGRQGRTEEAIGEFQAALCINPDLAEAHHALGQTYRRRGRIDEAIGEYQAALRINGDYAEAHYNLGVAYVRHGRSEEGILEYQAALQINPDYAEAHYRLGVVYGQQSRIEEAISEYQAARRINPNHAEARFALGWAYGQQARIEEEISEYEAGLRINRDDAVAHCNLGWAYHRHGRIEEAIGQYQKALRINPDYARAHFGLGWAYARNDRTEEAIGEYQAALRIDSDYAEAHCAVGLAYEAQGRRDAARREARLALQLGYEPAGELVARLG